MARKLHRRCIIGFLAASLCAFGKYSAMFIEFWKIHWDW